MKKKIIYLIVVVVTLITSFFSGCTWMGFNSGTEVLSDSLSVSQNRPQSNIEFADTNVIFSLRTIAQVTQSGVAVEEASRAIAVYDSIVAPIIASRLSEVASTQGIGTQNCIELAKFYQELTTDNLIKVVSKNKVLAVDIADVIYNIGVVTKQKQFARLSFSYLLKQL